MLESVACAFGWINPLLGQMARSPCRADKPQSTRHPSCICVCVCVSVFTKKKRKSSTGRLAVATTVDGSVLVWNMTGESVCVCAHACGRLFLEYYP